MATLVKVAIPIYGVLNSVPKFVGVSAIEDKRPYIDASPLACVSSRDSPVATPPRDVASRRYAAPGES